MTDSNEKQDLFANAATARKKALSILKPSWLGSWKWSMPSFTEALDWLLVHPAKLRNGEYISSTPDKEVWHFQLSEAFGSTQIVFRKIDGYKLPLSSRLGMSPSLKEALNFAVFSSLGIQTPDVLACGESRVLGFLRSSFIITRYIKHSYSGETLMPIGSLRENVNLRMGFSKNLLRYLAKMHQAGYTSKGFHPRDILFPKQSYEKNPQLIWVGAETNLWTGSKNMFNIIPLDLVHIFVALRLSTKEIKELCEFYLTCNPDCGHSVQSLWDAMRDLPIGA
ncbi:MAG: hypothetical protein IKS20_11600 [Victivallales bacterium]|nr:hypothetical protein [Victivallales bacterium]